MTGVPVTRKQLVLLAVMLGVATAVIVAGEYASWLGSWGETSATLDSSTILTYPLVAAIAAWFASGSGRHRYQWMLDSASRDSHVVQLRLSAAQATSASAGFLAAAAMALIATSTQATFGRFPVVDLFAIVAGFFAAAGFGVLIATVLPSAVSAVAALAIVYAVEAVADAGKPSLRPLAGLLVADGRDRTYLGTASWMLGLRGAWLLALSLVLVAMAARAWSKVFSPFAVACLTAVPLLLVGDTGMTVDEAAVRPVCHHPRPTVTVCMSAAMDHTHRSVWSALEPEVDLLKGLADKEWRFMETSVARQMTASSIAGTVTVPFGTPHGDLGEAHVVARQDLQEQLSSSVLQANCGSSGAYTGRRPLAKPEDVIQAWLLSELDIPIDSDQPDGAHLSSTWLDYSSVQNFRQRWHAKSDGEREAWFRAHAPDVVQCQLRNVDVMTP